MHNALPSFVDDGGCTLAILDRLEFCPSHDAVRDQAVAARAGIDQALAHWPRLRPGRSLLRSLAAVWSSGFDPEACSHLSAGPRPIIVLGPANLALCSACAQEALGDINELVETTAMMNPGHCDLCQTTTNGSEMALQGFRLERYAFLVQCCPRCAAQVEAAIVHEEDRGRALHSA